MSTIDIRLQLFVTSEWEESLQYTRASERLRAVPSLPDEVFISSCDAGQDCTVLARRGNYGLQLRLSDPAASEPKAISLASAALGRLPDTPCDFAAGNKLPDPLALVSEADVERFGLRPHVSAVLKNPLTSAYYPADDGRVCPLFTLAVRRANLAGWRIMATDPGSAKAVFGVGTDAYRWRRADLIVREGGIVMVFGSVAESFLLFGDLAPYLEELARLAVQRIRA
jgi:hypothetical protein